VQSFRRARAGAGEVARRVFAGAHALSPALLDRVPKGPGDIISALYEPLLAAGGRIASLSTSRRWHDLGTPRRYLDGVLDAISGPFGRRAIAAGALVDPGARVQGSVVETGAVVERGASIEGSVILPGASVAEGARLVRVVLGHGAAVAAGTVLENVLATRGSSREDPLVLTPLGGH
jgi:mannose-1-phosphate guanylyltransferase